MKKFFTVLIFLFPMVAFGQSFDESITTSNGYCTEDSHVGANDCTRAFNLSLKNTNYWQASHAANHYVGWYSYSDFWLSSYSMIENQSDTNFYPTAWTVSVSDDGENWTVVDTQSGVTLNYGIQANFSIDTPTEAQYVKLTFQKDGPSGILLTQVGFFGTKTDPTLSGSGITTTKYETIFDQDTLTELTIVDVSITFFIGIFGIIFYFIRYKRL